MVLSEFSTKISHRFLPFLGTICFFQILPWNGRLRKTWRIIEKNKKVNFFFPCTQTLIDIDTKQTKQFKGSHFTGVHLRVERGKNKPYRRSGNWIRSLTHAVILIEHRVCNIEYFYFANLIQKMIGERKFSRLFFNAPSI